VTHEVAYTLAIAALLPAAGAAWLAVRGHQVTDALFYAVSVIEVALLVQLVGGCIALARTDRDVDGVTFVSYLVTVVLVPPAAFLWGVAEKSRWGTGVLVVGMLTVSVLCVRILGIWTSGHA
jgi:hypothetical protein